MTELLTFFFPSLSVFVLCPRPSISSSPSRFGLFFLLSHPDSSLLPNEKMKQQFRWRGDQKKKKRKNRINSSKLYVWESPRASWSLFHSSCATCEAILEKETLRRSLTHRSPRCLPTPRGLDRTRAASLRDDLRSDKTGWERRHFLAGWTYFIYFILPHGLCALKVKGSTPSPPGEYFRCEATINNNSGY